MGILKHLQGILPVQTIPTDDEVLGFLNEVSQSYLSAMKAEGF